jgi:glycosyltransferase involved in cell wall biosynthesis
VLYVAGAPFYSGAERALVLTLASLDPARYEPYVVLGTDGEMAAQLASRGVPFEIVPLVHRDRRRLPGWVRSVARLVGACRRVRPAVIHANDMPSYQPAGYAGRLLGIPAITHLRFPDEDAGFRWFLRPPFEKALFVSEYLRADAASKSPDLFDGRSQVLYDGVVEMAPPTDAGRGQLKAQLGLPSGEPVVALTGQIAEVKGIWDFVDAMHLLHERRSPCAFAVLGDDLKGHGALRVEMERRVAELGLRDRVTFLGFRSNAPALIPAFDVVAVPSHVEPLGNATLEAMAAGVPVVGSRVGGIPEMVVHGQTGLLVPPRDPASLADAIDRIVRDPALRASCGRAARQRALEVFSVEAHGRALQAIYDDLTR